MSTDRSDQVEPASGSRPTCSSDASSAPARRPNESDEQAAERRALAERLGRIRHKVMVLSGKGGVGKSTVAVNLAVALARAGRRVGLLDVDLHGPSVPRMLGLEGRRVEVRGGAIVPVTAGGLKVLSVGFLLPERDAPVIWRGPMKMQVIRQFLADVEWGDLDWLVIDSPPGTGDEPLSVCQLVDGADGAVLVTTPQEVALADVRRSVNFCRQLGLPVLGVLENMSGFACPHCGRTTPLFGAGGGERMADEMGVPLLGRIPIDPQMVEACDAGTPYIERFPESAAAKAFERAVAPLLALDVAGGAGAVTAAAAAAAPAESIASKEKRIMRIAIPLADGKLAVHFGHCREFALVDVDPHTGIVAGTATVEPPPHAPGVLPKWLAEQGAQVIIAGGMGQRAQDLFAQEGIATVVGAPAKTPADLVADYVAGTLEAGTNLCDH